MNKLLFIVFLTIFSNNFLLSEPSNKSDSLKKVLSKTQLDTFHVDILLKIGDIYEDKLPDSAIFYYQKAFNAAEKIKNPKYAAIATQYIAAVYRDNSIPDSSILYYFKSIVYGEITDNIYHLSNCYLGLGAVEFEKGNLDGALAYYLKSLSYAEKIKDKNIMGKCLMNIGVIHRYHENYALSLKYFHKALEIAKELDDKRSIGNCYNNIGNVYNMKESFDTAITNYLKALEIWQVLNKRGGMAITYNNIGVVYKSQHEQEKAIEYYEKSLALYKQLNDRVGIARVLGNLADINLDLAEYKTNTVLQRNTYLKKSLQYSLEAIDLARELKATITENYISKHLFVAYKNLGMYNKATEYASVYMATYDSVFKKEKTEAIAEMETKYQTEKKQLQIEQLEKEKEIQTQKIARKEAEAKKQRIVILSFVIGFILIFVFSIIISRLYLQKKQAYIEIAEKNEELHQAYEEITAQRDEIERHNEHLEILNQELNQQKEEITAQRDHLETLNHELEQQKEEITAQRDEIEQKNQSLELANAMVKAKNKNITDSIRYAKRIQKAIMPPQNLVYKELPNSFILFEPKDIVSGDFYWFEKSENKIFFAAVDCTGHGVPGALMSVVGYDILNRAILEQHLSKPNEILNFLSNKINENLRQRADDNQIKDGMDIALCCFNKTAMILEYAGASNPLYLLRNNEIYVYNADRRPIGEPFNERFTTYTNNIIAVQPNDSVFIFTDGFSDQFGGPEQKKYMSKQLKDNLIKIQNMPMAEQKEFLLKSFMDWKGADDQIDDVLIFAVKF